MGKFLWPYRFVHILSVLLLLSLHVIPQRDPSTWSLNVVPQLCPCPQLGLYPQLDPCPQLGPSIWSLNLVLNMVPQLGPSTCSLNLFLQLGPSTWSLNFVPLLKGKFIRSFWSCFGTPCMLYKARPSAVQCCGGRGTGKGWLCLCVWWPVPVSQWHRLSSDQSRSRAWAWWRCLPRVRGEAWTHGRISVSGVQKSKLMVRFFSTFIYLIFFGRTWGLEDVTRLQKSMPMVTLSHSHQSPITRKWTQVTEWVTFL